MHGQTLLKHAVRNLNQSYFAWGIFEQLENSLNYLRSVLSLGELGDTKTLYQRTPERPLVNELDPQTLQAIRKAHDLDLELYALARDANKKRMRV